MKKEIEDIALFDMDGTMCDYDGEMKRCLEKLAGPDEETILRWDEEPEYIEERKNLIRNQPGWWQNLPAFELGFDILGMAISLGFKPHVLTKGPHSSISAWTEKVIWCRQNLPDNVPVTITEDKGLVYGKVLVDDYLDYALRWLEWRPRGLVIMPAHPYNLHADESSKNIIRYDGTDKSKELVFEGLKKAKERK